MIIIPVCEGHGHVCCTWFKGGLHAISQLQSEYIDRHKTAQLLEALHAQDTATASSFPAGLLIANDSDNKRTHMLIHQAARLPSPSVMVTNHDASIYPSIKIPSEQVHFPTGTKRRIISKRQHQLLFDRILCDVPCSGDGTLRKNLGIWKSWTPTDGNGLHGCAISYLFQERRPD